MRRGLLPARLDAATPPSCNYTGRGPIPEGGAQVATINIVFSARQWKDDWEI